MIIIKSIIISFIQIRYTDDFPSTGTRLVDIIILSFVLQTHNYDSCGLLCLRFSVFMKWKMSTVWLDNVNVQ